MKKRYAVQNGQHPKAMPEVIVLVLLVCLASWAGGYLLSLGFPMREQPAASPLWNFLQSHITGSRAAFITGISLAGIAGFLLYRLSYASVLIREKTALPFLLYFFLASTSLGFMPFMVSSATLFFLIFAIYLLFTSYHDETSVRDAFNWSFIIGAGSLLWAHILLYLPLFWHGMYSLRSFSPKTLAASIFGVSVVYWLLFGWCVWQGDFTHFTQPFGMLAAFSLPVIDKYHWAGMMPLIAAIAVAALASFRILLYGYEEKQRTRSSLVFLIRFAALTLIFAAVYGQLAAEYLQIACIPISILASHFFTISRVRYIYIYRLLLFVLILCTAYQFFRLWNSL